MKRVNKFLIVSSLFILCNQTIYCAAAKPVPTEKSGTLGKENPITSILSIACLKGIFSAETAGTIGKPANFEQYAKAQFEPGAKVKLVRGFNASSNKNKGKVRNTVMVTSQGRAKTGADMQKAFDLCPTERAFLACEVMPFEKISEIAFGDEKAASEALKKYFDENLDLIDPSKLYTLDGEATVHHVSALAKDDSSGSAAAK